MFDDFSFENNFTEPLDVVTRDMQGEFPSQKEEKKQCNSNTQNGENHSICITLGFGIFP